MKKNWKLWFSSTFLLLLVILVFAAPHLPFVNPELERTVSIKNADGSFSLPPYPPRKEFPLGSDHDGVGVLDQILLGAKETLTIVLLVVLIRYILAIPLAIGGFYSRFIEKCLQIWQQLFSFMPPIFFVSFFVALPFVFFFCKSGLLGDPHPCCS